MTELIKRERIGNYDLCLEKIDKGYKVCFGLNTNAVTTSNIELFEEYENALKYFKMCIPYLQN